MQKALVPAEPKPEHFTELRDARSSVQNLMTVAQDFGVASMMARPGTPAWSLADATKQKILRMCAYSSQALDYLLLEPTMANLSEDDRQQVTVIRIQQKVTAVTMANLLLDSELRVDAYVDEWNEIITLSEELFSGCYGTSACQTGTRANFSFQMQHLSPIYNTAYKCRNPSIRRRALALLRECPRREGFWDSRMLVKIVERVHEIESEGIEELRDPWGEAVPSEWVRINNLSVNPGTDEDAGTLSVTFRRRPGKGGSAEKENMRWTVRWLSSTETLTL